ncbi:glycosyl hydrolase [Crepidotus variabilis]|uniref:Glycosyl hydrolase n=1 Tax=Crepidotus variabilis TaxID=179855 RepID=A0A9P6EIN1_9AGAR|nr:glycosyl hydrolase [Crepidotus variabilis]
MNDPNGAMYDPVKDEYHLFYQWHPNHVQWGNISWGHAVSKNLVTWTDVAHRGTPSWHGANALALSPTGVGTYNGLGIFSGTAQPVGINGAKDGILIVFYTSVSVLPVPHAPDGETQSIAISKDGGRTWKDYEGNPVIKSCPEGWDITGFRDPFVEPWPEMDQVLQQQEPHYYMTVGGGIKDVGPRVMFYAAPASNLTKWTFLGSLWELKAGDSAGPNICNWGNNLEMPNFFSLLDQDGHTHYYLGTGANDDMRSIWNEGSVYKREDGSVAFQPISGGYSDYGNLYGLTSFNDTKHNHRRVQWGWSLEDFPADYASQQGYQGSLAVPRELFALVTKNLLDPDRKLRESGAFITQLADGTYQASVLGVKPLQDVIQGLREGASHTNFGNVVGCFFTILSTKGSLHFELSASFSSGSLGGFVVATSPGKEEYTSVYFNPDTHEITVDRTHSTTLSNFNNSPVRGHFLPYTTTGGIEDISLRVFLDGSLLEVYVNDRFALTTRIYPDRYDSTGFGLFTAEEKSVNFHNVQSWVGTLNAWPDRPEDTSSLLIVDAHEQTNHGVWWTGK